jgi:hypothetical protein
VTPTTMMVRTHLATDRESEADVGVEAVAGSGTQMLTVIRTVIAIATRYWRWTVGPIL